MSHVNAAETFKLAAWRFCPIQSPAQSLQNRLCLCVALSCYGFQRFCAVTFSKQGKIEALESVMGRGKKNPSPWQQEPANKRKHLLGVLAMPLPCHDEIYCTEKGAEKWQKSVCVKNPVFMTVFAGLYFCLTMQLFRVSWAWLMEIKNLKLLKNHNVYVLFNMKSNPYDYCHILCSNLEATI